MAKAPTRRKAYEPADYGLADVLAIKALATGTANEDQQKRALDWVINHACAAYDLSYRPDGDGGSRDTDFAEGRRFAGLQVVKLANLPAKIVDAMRTKTT